MENTGVNLHSGGGTFAVCLYIALAAAHPSQLMGTASVQRLICQFFLVAKRY